MKTFLLALVVTLPLTIVSVLSFTPTAQAQCLTELDGCHICVSPAGALEISGCGPGGGSTCLPFPDSLLVADPDVDGGLHTLLVSRLLPMWQAGGTIPSLYRDERRSFAASALYATLTANPAAIGSGAEWAKTIGPALLERAAGCLQAAEVHRFGSTSGVTRLGVVPRSSSGGYGCSGPELSWLIRTVAADDLQAGLAPLSQDEMRPFVVEGLAATTEADEDAGEFLAGVAAMMWEHYGSEEAALEAIPGLAVVLDEIKADQEGGRE